VGRLISARGIESISGLNLRIAVKSQNGKLAKYISPTLGIS